MPTLYAVAAERMVSRQLGGSCEVPLAAHAVWSGDQLSIRSFVASVDGKEMCLAEGCGLVVNIQQAEDLGLLVAQDLLSQGAGALLP